MRGDERTFVLSDEAQDAADRLSGKALDDAREIGRGTKAAPFDPEDEHARTTKPPRSFEEFRRRAKPEPPPEEPKREMGHCENCGTSFIRRKSGKPQLYCCDACGSVARTEKAAANGLRAKRPVQWVATDPVICKNPGCGKPVEQSRKGGRRREFCCDACRMKVKNDRARVAGSKPLPKPSLAHKVQTLAGLYQQLCRWMEAAEEMRAGFEGLGEAPPEPLRRLLEG